ncbi:MAG: hypothetical protein QME05_05250 [Candidatus Margulisbacteria bacterium]|nr:hypothetical protein [Candidatus Margulisiibacteriota bacterium]
MLAYKLLTRLKIIQPPPQKGYYTYRRQIPQGRTIKVENLCLPLAKDPHFLPPAWASGLQSSSRIEQIDITGRVHITPEGFSPEGNPDSRLPERTILGIAVTYQPNGERSTRIVSLGKGAILGKLRGKFPVLDQIDLLQRTIEIVPSSNPKRSKVIAARMEATGMRDDQSAYIYDLSTEAVQRIRHEFGEGVRLRQLTITITPQKEVVLTSPDGSRQLILTARHFRDSFGKELLDNRNGGMSTPNDFYHSDSYTPETRRFHPVIDIYPLKGGSYHLILHKTEVFEIERPDNLKEIDLRTKIFPTRATAAVKVDSRWIPLLLKEPLTELDVLHLDLGLSRIQDGRYQAGLAAQDRTGNRGEMSGDYPRDPTFYGFAAFRRAQHWLRYGNNTAINRGKQVDGVDSAIQSGRTHTTTAEAFFDSLCADWCYTNNPYTLKHSNFGSEFSGPCVSEDTGMEVAGKFKGQKMAVTNEPTTIMPAEKRAGKYEMQNCNRYILSISLFVRIFNLTVKDIILGRWLGIRPVYLKWRQIAENTAGRTWYYWCMAELVKIAAVPIFLGSMGNVLFFPVDLRYFIIAWTLRTVISTATYLQQLVTIGYDEWKGFKTGMFVNPAYERGFLSGYTKAIIQQFLDRRQWATFALTVGGAEKLPSRLPAITSLVTESVALAAAGYFIVVGGLGQLAWPLGLAVGVNLFFGAFDAVINLVCIKKINKEPQPKKPETEPPAKSLYAFSQKCPSDYNRFKEIADSIIRCYAGSGSLPYDELFTFKHDLEDILRNPTIAAMGKKDRPYLAWSNAYRNVANLILDLISDIETHILIRGTNTLNQSSDPAEIAEAREALVKLLKELKGEFPITDAALKALRPHRITADEIDK